MSDTLRSTQIGSKKLDRIVKGVPMRLILIALVVIWTVPTLGLLVSSFRTSEAISDSGWWTALAHLFDGSQWTLQNYHDVIFADFMGLAFFNSLLVTVPSTVIPITIAAFAAYAIAWMDFPAREGIFVMIVGLLVVPLQMALIPVLRIYTENNLNGTYLGIWLAHTGFGLPLATYLLYGYISGIPKEIIESAHADGATPWMSFTRLVLPLSKPSIAAFGIFQFL
ncbi:MAG: carbohydrate ABC transporter permease, partial [Sediminispirochaetaceae bacterium]